MIIAWKIFRLAATGSDLWPSVVENSIPHKEPSILCDVRNGNDMKKDNKRMAYLPC